MPVKSPTDIEDTTLLYSILINGSAIKDYYPVLSVEIVHEVNKISYAEISIIDGDIEKSSFPISDSNDFIPGNEIEIEASYPGGDQQSIFKGIIVKQGLQLSGDGYLLSVTAKHKAVGMTFTRAEEEFKSKTDSGIMQGILSKYGVDCQIAATETQQEALFQKLATDWDLILCRAEFCGFIITMDGDQLTIGKPKFNGKAVLRIAFGDSLQTFNAELSAEKQASAIKASAWDIKNQDLLRSTASEPSLNAQGNITAKTMAGKLPVPQTLCLNSITPMSADDLKTWADGSLLRMRMGGVTGRVSFQGNGEIKTGDLIELDGVGDRYNGNAFVSGVTHSLEKGQWTTKVKFGLDQEAIHGQKGFSYSAATGQLPGIRGLQVATVQKLFEDPQGQDRIFIQLPSNAQNPDGLWARLSNFHATTGAGSGFIPEVGDEVVVGFLESDPRYPIILGSLYSSGRAPLNTAADNNNYIKTLTTKSKLKISFDDEKKVLLIQTPGGNSITLSDDGKSIELKDQNSNKVTLGSGGISLDSASDIQLQAKGSISLKATGKVSLSADQDVEVTGMNISQSAQAGYTAKGNASAELSASGQTVVKGAMVMIN